MISLSCFSWYLVSGDNLGADAYYWMIESAAQMNVIPTNVNVVLLGGCDTVEAVVRK
jgi:hypothetical protein